MKMSKPVFLKISFALIVCFGSCTERGVKTPVYTETTLNGKETLANTKRGMELFQQRCMACHGVNGAAGNNKAADLSMTRLDSLGIVTIIMNGRGTMPPFKDGIPDSDIAQIAIYVKSLRTK